MLSSHLFAEELAREFRPKSDEASRLSLDPRRRMNKPMVWHKGTELDCSKFD